MQGYRTIIFNLLMALLAAVRVLWPDCPTDEEVIKYFDAAWVVLMPVGNLILRKWFTKGPIGVKDPVCK